VTLNVKGFALACALLWGSGLFLITWWLILWEGPSNDTLFISRIYRGYSITPTGSLVGLAWGVADGLIGGALFAWLYNLITLRLHGSRSV
jgi:hypothetical protein